MLLYVYINGYLHLHRLSLVTAWPAFVPLLAFQSLIRTISSMNQPASTFLLRSNRSISAWLPRLYAVNLLAG
ncbi:hypothetical protein ASPCADRAFT_203919 [Aspergillus carbonarius ITEM 5010]|uniref:Uncharacterized protein n=1 Tax=Aspergillus carbonarius (strain ITEM 5010) TaxID=602072 RepID=A0A1R3S003_ASPC5|nr:hypothetical protein ASPCADRAFT_203919 [Aspergillus carbonarius ITEM 5010]